MTTSTALAKIEQSSRAPANLGNFLEVVKPRLKEVLPAHVNAETLIRVVQTFGNQNERLLKCSESSLLTSLMLCSQLGLPPNTPQGFAWLIPFWNSRQKAMECKVMFGYKGLAELVRNSGEIQRMNSGLIYEHEVLSGSFVATDEPPDIQHRPSLLARSEDRADDKLVGAYALIITKDGGRVQRILRRDEILKRRDASQAVQKAKEKGYSTPWDDWFGPQCRKTALRALCGSAEVPKNTDLVTALSNDVDSPAFDELQHVVATQADGFRQQAAMAALDATASEAAALPAGDPETAPEPADTKKKSPPRDTASKPKKATKAQTARLWGRWAKITDCDPKKPLDVDKDSFKGFVAHRIGEEKAQDSKVWTVEDCKVIDAGLDELRGKPGADPPATPPAEPTASPPETTTEQPEGAENSTPAITKSDALGQLKDLRAAYDMPWDQVRELAATECGVTAKSSAKWSVKELLAVIKAMKTVRASEAGGTPAEEQPAPPPEQEPPPAPDATPESEVLDFSKMTTDELAARANPPTGPATPEPPPRPAEPPPENEVDPEE